MKSGQVLLTGAEGMFGGDPAELHVPTCTVELCSPRSSSIKYFDIRHHFSFLNNNQQDWEKSWLEWDVHSQKAVVFISLDNGHHTC